MAMSFKIALLLAAFGQGESLANIQKSLNEARVKFVGETNVIKGDYEIEHIKLSTSNRSERGHYARDGSNKKLEFVRKQANNELDIVYCVNQNGAFKLSKQHVNGTYHIEGVGSDDLERVAMGILFERYIRAPIAIEGVDLADIASSQDYEFVGSSVIEANPKNLLEVKFRDKRQNRNENIIAAIDPANGWLISHAEMSYGSSKTRKYSYTISYGSQAFPLEGMAVNFQEPSGEMHHFRVTKAEQAQTPTDEFKMAFYGLTAPIAKPDSNTSSHMTVWLLALGLIGLSLSVIIRKLSKSR